MANMNPKQQQAGDLPVLGYHLNTKWKYVNALFVCIAAGYVLLVATMLWIARPVIVVEDSDMCVAKLL